MSTIVKSIKYEDLPHNDFSLDAFDNGNIYLNSHQVDKIEQKTITLKDGSKVKIYRLIKVNGMVVDIAAFLVKKDV